MIKPGSPIADSDYGEGLIHKMTTIRNTFSSEALSGRTVFAALALMAATLAAGMMFLLPVSPLHAQDANTIDYAENGTDPVATFSSTDPDGDTVTWTVDDSSASGAVPGDGARFEFSEDDPGELNFAASPNYEMPRGEAISESDNNTNTYKILVTATDDGTRELTATKEVVIKVTDVEERATISLSTRQPVVGQKLTATLGNADEVASGVRWTWERKDGATWADVEGTTTDSPMAPYTSTYTPAQSEIGAELRVGVEYIDNDDDNQAIVAVAFEQLVAASVGGTNVAPTFAEGSTATRTIAENSPEGTAVGDPVTATDDHRTALTYVLTGLGSDNFEINSKTGQISVSASAMLNYDPVGSTAAVTEYSLTVTVADPDGGSDGTIAVTVNVTDVAEAPKVTGPASMKVTEGMAVVGVYMGRDESVQSVGLTLEGADASAFSLTGDGDDYNLAFETPPDFEKPADTGSNNEYQVTVVTTDRGLKGMQAVVVRVTNANADGVIELTPDAPTVGMPVTAELTDEDVFQARTVTWVWSSKDDVNCNDTTTFGRGDRIAGATSDTYTPTAAECLRVTARYDDGHGANKSASVMVGVGARTNNMPVFTDDDPIIRSVNENEDAGTVVGTAIEATDVDTSGEDTLTYSVVSVVPASGAALFTIDNATGQLQTEEMLDYEEQASYVLEVKVTDSTSNSATVTVTVNVDDVNDKPGEIMDSRRNNGYAENGTAPVATFSSEDPDGNTITWTVSGTDGDLFDFSDDNPGELSFEATPNFEAAADGDMDNTYEITVTASDEDDTSPMMATKDVMVKVTDVEERATISLSTRQPVVGQELTATLENADEVASGVRWTWTGIEGTPTDKPADSTYTPLPGDANDRIRVGVKYIDTDGRDQTVATVAFERPVAPTLAEDADNELPEFADDPDGDPPTTMRTIAEDASVGTAVGDPVTATDDHRTALTYTMTESDNFKIDPKTGQISVSASAKLNYDTEAVSTYTLTVSVADPDGATGSPATIEVTVTVTDVAEAPEVKGPATKKVNEDFDSDDTVEERQLVVAPYTGTDEAGAAIGLTLEGADASAFVLTRISGGGDDDGSYNLAFNTAPDFEKPADTGSNNEYQVTVVATDRGLKGMQAVVVRVTNANADGVIELTPDAPTVGMPVTAELTDEDVFQARTVTWLWSSKTVVSPCDDTENTTFARGDRIAGATSDAYTPTAVGCLRVTARYTDGHGGNKNAMKTVAVAARTNNMPVFTDDDPIIRSVIENEDAGTVVGTAIEATDADTSGEDTLTYSVVSVVPASGAALFGISDMGQITTKAMLDHEEQASYVLEVKVTDSTGNSAMVTVTVMVNNVNDDPGAIMFTRGEVTNTAPEFASASAVRTVAEDAAVGADIGAAVEAADAGDTLTYTLGGTDAASFDIGSATGQLMTAVALDFETKTSYSVRVTATDSADASDFIDVTINVTDVDEEVVVQPGQTLLDRSDTDDDGEISKTEVVVAFREYIDSDGQIDKMEMIDVFRQYVEDQTG